MAVNRIIFKNAYDIKVSRKFYRYYTLRHSGMMYFLMAMGAICGLFIALGSVSPSDDNKFQFIMFLTITLIGLVFMPFYTFVNIRTSARKDFKQRGSQTEIYEITKEKIQRGIDGVNKKFAINWMTINSCVEMDDAFYFFTNTEEAFLINKSGLIEGDFDNLRHMIYVYMAKDKKGQTNFIVKDKEQKKILKEKKKQEKLNKKNK